MTASDTPGVTQRLANFSLQLDYRALPAKCITEAKSGILDTLGVALAAANEPPTRMLLRATSAARETGEATILGTRLRSTPVMAALINAYAAHLLDYDDTQHGAATHISAPVLPAALACAEIRHSSGKDLMAAYVAGYETGCWLGRVRGFGDYAMQCGFVPNGIVGVIGAAAAAGRLIGLDEMKMRRNFGIAAGHAAGTNLSFGTMCKAQITAHASQSGVLAALLAREGFTAPESIFDGKQNLISQYGGEVDAEELFRHLGHKFEILENTRKIYACAGWRNPILEATIALAETHGLEPRDVDWMEVRAWTGVSHKPNYPEPRTGLEAKFSGQYAAAVALTDRAGGMAQFTDERVADPALAALTRKVKLIFDEALQPFQIRVTVRTKDGREPSHFIPIQKGKHSNPITWDELAAKFRANALCALPSAQVEQLIAMVRELESVKDVAELARLCQPPGR